MTRKDFIFGFITFLLAFVFLTALAFRALHVYWFNPLDFRFSDPLRHWLNGARFFAPDMMGSSDPLMYQVWIGLVQLAVGENRLGVIIFTAALSVLMPLFWYLALRELLPRIWALAGAIVIAIMPSFIMIYSYFMNETLLLTLQAAAVWLSLRALRLNTTRSFAWAALMWALATYTRSIALPMAGFFLGILLLKHRHILRRGAIAAAFFVVLGLVASWHSGLWLNFYAPLGNMYTNEIYRLSGKRTIVLDMGQYGDWGFSSPSLYMQPFAPLSTLQSLRDGEVKVMIDPTKGREDWERELARVRVEPKPLTPLQDWLENAALFYFAASWPDNNPDILLGKLSALTRWLWLPMFVAMLWMSMSRHLRRAYFVLPALTFSVTMLLLFQHSAVMEGRYRKPVEPLLIASLITLLYERRRIKKEITNQISA